MWPLGTMDFLGMTTRVLVVDDSPTIRRVVADILEHHGYSALTAENGEDALEVLHSRPVDLVLTDFVMPRMNGYQFCREVRSDETLSHLPIVLMSAKGDKIRGHFVEQTGAADAITKPFDPLALIAVVEGALSRRDEAEERGSEPPSDDEPPESLELGPDEPPVELSNDPGLRRSQIAAQFARAVSRIVLPRVQDIEGLPSGLDSAIIKAITESITVERMGRLAALLHGLDFGQDRKEVLKGDLTFISIAEVLQMLELQRQSGALSIATGESEITLFVREGLLDYARARGMPSALRLGRYLVQMHAISRKDLTHFLDNRAGSKRLIGDALIQLGFVTEEQVARALERQTSELVYEVVGWKSGRFSFVRDATCPEATLAGLGLPPGGIVMEGFRRVDEWRLIEGSFDFDETLHRDQVAAERLSEEGKLTDTERAVLDAIDGQRTVRDIIDGVEASTFDICKILYQFLNSHLVRRRAA